MLKRMCNELVIRLQISPDGPVLIKSGSTGLGTDMVFVTTFRNGKEQVYFPGSSLKGVIRSHGERICHTLQAESVCHPFDSKERNEKSCSNYMSEINKDYWKNLLPPELYQALCPACRMFGSLRFKGRCFVNDAYCPDDATPPQPHIRDGVAICRKTGAAKGGAKYDFEVITSGTFETDISLVNFEFWQLDLLLLILRDLQDQRLRIGMGSSRGLGKIKTEIKKISYSEFGEKPKEPPEIRGIASIIGEEEGERYGFFADEKKPISLTEEWATVGIRHTAVVPTKYFDKMSQETRGALDEYLKEHKDKEHKTRIDDLTLQR